MTKPSPSPGSEILGVMAPSRRPDAGVEPPSAARWRAAEGRLYSLVTVDAALYEAAVTLVAEVTDVLRSQCGTVTDLADADATAVLTQCPSASAMSELGLDPHTAYDAACACRWRELTAQPTDAEPGNSQEGSR
jgi:hypothetical protein